MRFCFLILVIGLLNACKDPYLPRVVAGNKNYLTVEGFIDVDSNSVTRLRLTRSTNVNDIASVPAEHGAKVTIEQGGAIYPLTEADSGYYVSGAITLSRMDCTVRILTADGSSYTSKAIPVKITPAVDTINFAGKNGGVQLYVTSHNDDGDTRYYRWEYEETWEYHAPYQSSYVYDWSKQMLRMRTQLGRDTMFRCFESHASNTIELATSDGLQNDIVSQYPIVYIPPASIKLSVIYSLLVKQYALTKEAYSYYANLKKVTENLGDVFGTLPSELRGNFRNEKDGGEVVIGYVCASSVTQKRGFIFKEHDFQDWKYYIDLGRYQLSGLELPPLDTPLDSKYVYFFQVRSPCPIPKDTNTHVPPCNELYGACCSHAIPIYQFQGLMCTQDTTCIDCIFWGKGGRKMPDYWPR